ncbi:unnamed protein product [Rodentolepis nana]|uniref:Ovule protein n=1 Tax=Rodentolepis nana TaxID=102285 RepID=A0A0R3T8Q6_RODNA|nr:unnamed protein product [Rodentolepis nana]
MAVGMWLLQTTTDFLPLPKSRAANTSTNGMGQFLTTNSGLDTESGGSSSFPPVGYIGGIPNSATASILGQSGMSESVTVHCFSFVRALSSLHLEVVNSLLIKVLIVWMEISQAMHWKIGVSF